MGTSTRGWGGGTGGRRYTQPSLGCTISLPDGDGTEEVACHGITPPPPNDASNIEGVAVDIIRRPHRAEILVTGDFTAKLADPEGITSTEEIAASLAVFGMEVSTLWWYQ